MEHVAGEGGKHCRRAAQQHREQIETDRAEYEPIAADVVEALDHLLPWIGATVDLRPRDRADSEQSGEADREQDGARRVWREWRPGVEVAAKRRPRDRAALPGDR